MTSPAGPPLRGNRQRRAAATRRRVLQAAVSLIEEHGEAGLRVEDVATAASVSVGTVYRYFASREGLVVAARVAEYAGALDDDLDAIETLVDTATNPDELVVGLELVTRAAGDPARASLRVRRIEIIGAARARPELAEVIGAEQARITDRLADIARRAQERGLLDPALDPRAVALFIQAFTLGQVLADIDPSHPFDLDAWTAVAQRFARAVVADD